MSSLWTSADLLEATGGTFGEAFNASGVSIDTRTIVPGDLFVALVGEAGDGHDHVARAREAGAAGVMVHRDILSIGRRLVVDDTLAGLTRLGAFARARFPGRLVAVTGSVGKTTTKEMLRLALSAFGPTHAAVASYNNHWGVPLTLARTPRKAMFCIAEIGMNHAGEIAPLAALAQPHVAVITTVAAAHIGYLGGLDEIADEKAAILSGLDAGGVAVLPVDSPWFSRLRERAGSHHVVGFGAAAGAEARLMEIEQDANGSTLRAEIAGRELRMRLNAPGRHMAMNAVAALAAVAALGLDTAIAAQALERFTPLLGRGAHRRLSLPGGAALLLDESYNANGASMRAALDVLRLQPATRRVAILGDMLELGEAGPAEHAALAADAVRSADLVFTCGPLMWHLNQAIPARARADHAADAGALASIVAARVLAGDAILVKGSLGSRMKVIVEALDALTVAGDAAPTNARGGRG
ncbi:MAG: UDP-N-acetylmuramoyl-tripeptide--D-alanyl-D-alanine ligase [Acetobacteraceae bacterium]|nr:UDP-N-acetylmuramoyl-tripeptide--D-alanyl-D-alanine ligase [Acetobacteraceae bacterium]